MADNKPPAVVIIARHGSRLDAADKQWHLTSPTPYDPPLTYGGWMQSRALGARIAMILQSREDAYEENIRLAAGQGSNGAKPRRKKHRVIIHSSPFLRCVQTSIAISAGIAQHKKRLGSVSLGKSTVLRSASQRTGQDDTSSLSPIPEPAGPTANGGEGDATAKAGDLPQKLRITQLRIDAFLGEWLAPDYFEHITPPPGSLMMVAGAKAELLRPGENIEGADLGDRVNGHFPGGWKSVFREQPSTEDEDSHRLDNVTTMEVALPRARSNTLTSNEGRPKPRISTNVNSSGPNYVPPTPTYAISTSDPIPAGYVAHARDACVDVDYRWDSMRHPQDWGNGGEYGEEWSSMHKRFRSGLQRMIGWYDDEPEDASKDPETDTVLILVTHGAGCNALIGALTNQPVLLDVGMASLTMAHRKDAGDRADTACQPQNRPQHNRSPHSMDKSVSEEYEVKMIASTDHLRGGGVTPLSPAVASSPRFTPTSSRRPFGSTSSTEGVLDDGTISSAAKGLHRSSSSSLRSHAAILPIKKSSGLWGSNESPGQANEASDNVDIPDFGNADADPAESFATDSVKKMELSNGEPTIAIPPVPQHPSSQRGLWGGGTNARDSLAKRRWTVNEQNA